MVVVKKTKTMFRSLLVSTFLLVLFVGQVFAKVSQMPCFSSFIVVDFWGVRCEVFA